jgi:diguanylate cyclase (GGDEF)-like protein
MTLSSRPAAPGVVSSFNNRQGLNTIESVSDADVTIAQATGFAEFVIALRRTLRTTPVGWMLTVWFCWGRVPVGSLVGWVVVFVVAWAGSLMALQRVIAHGSKLDVHRIGIFWIAALDGVGWGLTAWLLIGHDQTLDALLMALLAGVTSINAQVYGTYIKAYYWQIGAMWIVSVSGLLHNAGRQNAVDYAVGLSVFMGLTLYYTRAISQRILAGIRLQHVNASLADQLRGALDKVERDAATDALTGHGNRRALDEVLKRQVELRTAGGKPFSVLMLDIDFFKTINDRFGHMVGDDALRAFAQRLREFLRSRDFCARFGGEEFVVVLPETPLAMALDVAERIRKGVSQSALLDEPRVRVTVSIGVATMARDQSIGELLAAADAAVYLAKNAGRDQVRSYEQAPAHDADGVPAAAMRKRAERWAAGG